MLAPEHAGHAPPRAYPDLREHIDALSHKYIGKDYPWIGPGEQRKKFVVTPEKVRYIKQ